MQGFVRTQPSTCHLPSMSSKLSEASSRTAGSTSRGNSSAGANAGGAMVNESRLAYAYWTGCMPKLSLKSPSASALMLATMVGIFVAGIVSGLSGRSECRTWLKQPRFPR